ncbi:hypothetical protein KFV02_01495 [Desulfohalobiaceae bacterium Ax17]|uniref:hypothetical protein n=1 Tax=Desulfovulcanus ferrireducens TaxID=2831190 RepID=UPI00207B9905|nr:hypothetical protein [Desulfovulcanus ferrireducens]MBT8762606.1 hypothetical protein [Desulfovulcanus ferrireducens]
MTANNEQQSLNEIIELTEVVEEGTSLKKTDKKESENVEAFPKEKAVEGKDFDEELSDIFESVIDESKPGEKTKEDEIDDLGFDDLFEEEALIEAKESPEERAIDKREEPSQDDSTIQSSVTTEEFGDEFAELDNIIADLDESSPDKVQKDVSAEEKSLSYIEKSVQKNQSEHKEKKLDEDALNTETSPDNPENQDIEKIAALEDKFMVLEQKIDTIETEFENKLTGIKNELINEINSQVAEQVKLQLAKMLPAELDPLKQKIEQVEEKLNNLSIPGNDEIKEIVVQELNRIQVENKDVDDDKLKEELQNYMIELVGQRLEKETSTWHREKKALAQEIENALKYWGKLQDRLENMSSELAKVKDIPSSEDFSKQIEDISHNFVTRDDLKLLANQLKIEMEEFVSKKVPAAAAQVIREEISALLAQKSNKK